MGAIIGTMHVRRSAHINASPERVWSEFESFDRLEAWFGIGHTLHSYEPRRGGSVQLSADIDGKRQHYGGSIVVFEPAREVTFQINWEDPGLAWPTPTMWTLRLTSSYDGTMVEIFHHGFERFGQAGGSELECFEEGWDNKHLKALRGIVEQ